MPRFEPFPGVRYDTTRSDLAAVTAPPYDVIDEELRAALAARDPHNVVRIDLPLDEGGVDRYEVARRLFHQWQDDGILVADDQASFYVYRMDHTDEQGRARHTTGVIGALELSRPGDGDILPHEHTTPKARTDRLEMLRSCEANLSPIWGLSTAAGLSELCSRADDLLGDWVDDEGVRHRLWRVPDGGLARDIADAVGGRPVVIADGHHRYETSLAYRDERRSSGGGAGDFDLTMTFVVELADDELTVLPIHRLLSGLPDGFDLVGALSTSFDVSPTAAVDPSVGQRMLDAGSLCLATRDGAWLLRPTPRLVEAAGRDLDSSRLDAALADLPPSTLTYQHGVDNVLRAIDKGDAQAGILLRPATVDQIIDIAEGGERMPPKTTFFYPKPRTGPVLRSL